MKTINLKGKNYAPVSARVEQFHKDHKDGSITTETTFTEGYVIVKATITFGLDDVAQVTHRTFTGHSYGTVKGEKAFEKLETTAVGRALAFAGYLAGGEIASYDEIENFVDDVLTIDEAVFKLMDCKSLTELQSVFVDFPHNIKSDKEVILKKDEMKAKLA